MEADSYEDLSSMEMSGISSRGSLTRFDSSDPPITFIVLLPPSSALYYFPVPEIVCFLNPPILGLTAIVSAVYFEDSWSSIMVFIIAQLLSLLTNEIGFPPLLSAESIRGGFDGSLLALTMALIIVGPPAPLPLLPLILLLILSNFDLESFLLSSRKSWKSNSDSGPLS